MQATPPPARWWWEAERWQRWGGRGRNGASPEVLAQLRLQRLQRLRELHALLDRQKLAMPDLLIYSPPKFTNINQVHTAIQPTLSWSQRPLPWDMTDYDNAMKHLETLNEGARSKVKFDVEQGMWGAARGWAVGALLLLAALIILRATDRCLARGFFRSRRRQSEEWTTPSVQATRHHQDDIISVLNAVDSNRSESNLSSDATDPPPPYSACSNKNEEPPPPYSACYVAYPKDGQSVRLYDGQQQIITDNSQHEEQVAHSHNRLNHGQDSTDDVTVNIENPLAPTVRLAPMASQEQSIDSDDASLEAKNSTSC